MRILALLGVYMKDFNWDEIKERSLIEPKTVINTAGDYNNWKNLLPKSSNGFEIDWKSIEAAFPDWINSMKNCPQEPDYHLEGDVWTHTKMVMNALIENTDFQSLNETEREILFFTALLHDVGKPYTLKRDEDNGRITSKGHSKRGSKESRIMLWFAGAPPYIRENIANLITHHQLPYTWEKKASIFELREISQSVNMKLLCNLSLADAIGRITRPVQEKNLIIDRVKLFKYACEDENCLTQPWTYDFSNPHAERLYWEGKGDVFEGRDVFWEKGSEVILLSGLPASGKDYWCELYGKDLPVLSLDTLREKMKIKNNSKAKGEAIQLMNEMARELLRDNAPFIWNATHFSTSMREKNINLLRQYGATVRIVHLESDYNTLIKRNNERGSTLPSSKIIDMAWKWEPALPTEAHEVIWWDGKPVYIPFITSKDSFKDEFDIKFNNVKQNFKL